MMITLEAANYQRALGQSQYIRLDPRSLKSDMELYGVDATLIQSDAGEHQVCRKVVKHSVEGFLSKSTY